MSSYREQETSFYDLLEVRPDSGPTEIYEAYQRARETYSPHSAAIYSMFTEAETKELLKLIDEAYATLSNKSRKRSYDLKLGLIKADDVEPPTTFNQTRPSSLNLADQAGSVVEERKVGKSEEGWTGVVKVYRKSDEIPPGQERTRFGLYKIDDNLEKEITSVEECDGSFLQRIRKYRNVSLEDLSEAMKISKSSLRALEENELDRLPVQVFTRGIVVQYCRMLNLEEDKLVNAYMTYFKANKK
jgi:curved DNA-binding protein CbpA